MTERVAYRGLLSNEAEKLSDEDYFKLLTSRQRRFIERNSIQYRELKEKVEKCKKKGKPVRTHTREAVILPSWIGMNFAVHNGKEFQNLTITAGMLGHRLGEFVYTTKRVVHSSPGVKATRGSKFLSNK